MSLYGGIDLHSNNHYVVILDKELKTLFQGRLRNDLGETLACLEPYREDVVGIAVESTRNWYWLVDGLMEAGYRVHLTNTSAVRQYEGLKYADDRWDARWLARLLCLGILPEGYIYPKEQRPWRDLLRRRAFLVRKRTSLLLSMGATYEQHTGVRVTASEMKRWRAREVEGLMDDPRVALSISSVLRVTTVLSAQIRRIEKAVLSEAKLREEFHLLRTVRGIGEAIALTIMCEVGDIGRFAKAGNFASYCRCVSTARISNAKKKGSGNKRNGNPYLSWAFTEAAHFAIRFEPLARRYVERKAAKTHRIVAIRALANKLARACYYVMRDQVPFEPERAFG